MKERKKLLIIVGGGIYGVIPAHLLGTLPEKYIKRGLSGIDCLAGCSIGGILAAAYAAGYRYDFIDSYFQNHVVDCFTKRWTAHFSAIACPTYCRDGLDGVIDSLLADVTMGQVREKYPHLDLFIPGLNLTDDRYKVFDNITPGDENTTLATIAKITSAAPSYFAGVEHDGKCYIDGGLVEVAPLLTAATALKSKRGVDFSDMDVLMIGTGRDVDDEPITACDYNNYGLLSLATKVIVPYATLANELATVYWGKNMGFNSFTYFNPITHNGQLDDVDQVPEMVEQAEKYSAIFTDIYRRWLDE